MNKFTLFWCFLHLLNAIYTASADYLTSEEWNSFKARFSKTYHSEKEEQYRFSVFMKNIRYIDQHNEKYRKGEVTFGMGINSFSDLSHEEFVKMTGRDIYQTEKTSKLARIAKETNTTYYKPPKNYKAPSRTDWRLEGAVSKIKHQSRCAACWAFSATGSLEGQYAIMNGELISLSEQELIDCTCNPKYENIACSGGNKETAFDYVKDHGIATDTTYSYDDELRQCRREKRRRSKVKVTGYVEIRPGDENALKMAVAHIGPISVSFDAGQESFDKYTEGIYSERYCSNTITNHAMLIVGYGTENGVDYWLVKNSWGEEWGIKGYMKVIRNSRYNCAIAIRASFPLVSKIW